MSLNKRRLLYIIFILAFFIITPLITLYAAGFSYNFKKGKIEKTGILYVESKPRDAAIYLNDKYQKNTPARLTRLLPETYRVSVKKDNYFDWQKNLVINSNLTTFAKNIILFKISSPQKIIEGNINLLTVSPSHDRIIYSLIKNKVEQLRLYNLKNQTDLLIKEFDQKTYSQLEFGQWSPSQQKIIIKQTIGDVDQYLVIDVETLKTKPLKDISQLNFEKLVWDQIDDGYLYGLRKSILYQIDLLKSETKMIVLPKINDFFVWGKKIYYIALEKNELLLNQITLTEDQVSESKKIKLPPGSHLTFQSSSANYLTLIDQRNRDLFIINNDFFTDSDINKNLILQDKANNLIWSQNNQNILYYNDYEIWTYNFTRQEKNLITRFGQPIGQAIWYWQNNYLIYLANNSIITIENTAEEMKNETKLTEAATIDQILIDDTGNSLYFKGTIDNQPGIYKLELQ